MAASKEYTGFKFGEAGLYGGQQANSPGSKLC